MSQKPVSGRKASESKASESMPTYDTSSKTMKRRERAAAYHTKKEVVSFQARLVPDQSEGKTKERNLDT